MFDTFPHYLGSCSAPPLEKLGNIPLYGSTVTYTATPSFWVEGFLKVFAVINNFVVNNLVQTSVSIE